MKTVMEICNYSFKNQILFNSEEEAQAVFDNLTEKLREFDLYSSLNKKEQQTFTFETATGPFTAMLSKIESIRLLDEETWNAHPVIKAGEKLICDREVARERALLQVRKEFA